MTASPTFWLTVAAIFAANALLSWAWHEPVLALAQVATATLAAAAGWAARRRLTARAHAADRENR